MAPGLTAFRNSWIKCSKYSTIPDRMSAAYDKYDYLKYWIGRDYEHKSEVIALRALLTKIKKIKTILEIGAGFGRLVSSYSFRAKKIILSDPSAKTLKVARSAFKNKKNIKFIHSPVLAIIPLLNASLMPESDSLIQ